MEYDFHSTDRIDATIERGYTFSMSDYLNAGWEFFKNQAVLFVVFILVYLAGSAVINMIPIVGGIGRWIFVTPLAVGPGIVCYQMAKGRSVEFNQFFGGFKFLGQLLLASLVTGLLTVMALIPLFIFLGITIGSLMIDFFSLVSTTENPDPEQIFSILSQAINPVTILVSFLLFIPGFIVGVLYMFAPYFVIFYNLDFWPAMEYSRKLVMPKLLPFIGFIIVLGLLNLLGAICLIVGLLVTIPVSMIAGYAAFQMILGLDEDEGESEEDLISNLVTD